MNALPLSNPMRKVLTRMATGQDIETTGGRFNSAFWHGAIGETVRFDTLHALWRRHLIAAYGREPGKCYRITVAGYEALKQTP